MRSSIPFRDISLKEKLSGNLFPRIALAGFLVLALLLMVGPQFFGSNHLLGGSQQAAVSVSTDKDYVHSLSAKSQIASSRTEVASSHSEGLHSIGEEGSAHHDHSGHNHSSHAHDSAYHGLASHKNTSNQSAASKSAKSEFSTRGKFFSKAKIEELKALYNKSSKSGESVDVRVPLSEGLTADSGQKFALTPNNIVASTYASAVNGVPISEQPSVLTFGGLSEENSNDEYLRLSLIQLDSGETVVRGFARSGNSYYDIVSDEDSLEFATVEELSAEDIGTAVKNCPVEEFHEEGENSNSETLGASASNGGGIQAASLGTSGSSFDIRFDTIGDNTSASGTTSSTGGPGVILANGLPVLEVATDADFEYFTSNGSSTSQTNAEIIAVLNGVDALYRDQLGLSVSVVFQNVWSSSGDPYSGSAANGLLGQLLGHWAGNFEGSVNYDVAHLFTGRTLSGSVAGVAYLGSACRGGRYGLSSRFASRSLTIPLAAHEIAHNLGSDHDSCSGSEWIMCPSLAADSSEFSPASRSAISSYVGSVSCIEPSDDAVVTPPPPPPAPTPTLPPIFDPVGSRVVQEGQTLVINLTGRDPDGTAVSFSADNLPSGASLNGNVFTFPTNSQTVTGGATQRVFNVTFRIWDNQGQSTFQTVSITVQDVPVAPPAPTPVPPILDPIDSRVVSEGETLVISLSGRDPDGTSVSFSVDSLPPGASLSGNVFTFPTNSQTVSAGSAQAFFTVTFRIFDNQGQSSSQTINITVLDVATLAPTPPAPTPVPPAPNTSPPVLEPIDSRVVSEGETLSIALSGFDPDGTSVSYSATGLPPGSRLVGNIFTFPTNPLTVSGGSARAFFTVTFIITDNQGQSASRTINITVEDVNRPPSFVDVTTLNVQVGQLLRYQFVAVDPDVEAVDYVSDVLPAGASFTSSGLLTWEPTSAQVGTSRLIFYARDEDGLFDTLNVSVNVLAAPIPEQPGNSTPEDEVGTGFDAEPGEIRSDYNGNGVADLAVYRPSTLEWFFGSLGGSTDSTVLGSPAAIPLVGDFDGDRISDPVYWEPFKAEFQIRYSKSQGQRTFRIGSPGSIPMSKSHL